MAHVACHPWQVRHLLQQRQGQIETQRTVAATAQCLCVPTGTTRQIQNRIRALAGNMLLDKLDMRLGFTGVAVGIESEVLLPEPLLVPRYPAMIAVDGCPQWT